MEFSAKQIAQFIGGTIEGDENAKVHTFAKIEEGEPGAISFLANGKYAHYLNETLSSIVLIDETIILERPVKTTLIRVKNARDCVAKLLQMYEAAKPKKPASTSWHSFRQRPQSARTSTSEHLPTSETAHTLQTVARFIRTP